MDSLTRAGCVAVHAYVLVGGMETWLMMYHVILIFQFTTNDLLYKFRTLLQQQSDMDSRKTERLLHYHRCFTVETYNFKQYFGFIYGATHVIAIVTIVLCNYEAVQLTVPEALGMGFISASWAMLVVVFLDLIAEVNRRSQLFLAQARRQCFTVRVERKALRAEILSMRVCRVEMGHFFYFDKGIILTTLAIIVQNTITLILTN